MTESNAVRYRVEIHLRNVRSCQIDFDSYSLIRCRIDQRTREMMSCHLLEKFVHKTENTRGSVMFKFLAMPVRGDGTSHSVAISAEKVEGFVRYTDGHAMLLISVTPEEYDELRSSFYLLQGLEFGIEFDFEPHMHRRNYNCTGIRGVPVDGELM